MARKIYPNDPCPCSSGKKYKRCCGTVLNTSKQCNQNADRNEDLVGDLAEELSDCNIGENLSRLQNNERYWSIIHKWYCESKRAKDKYLIEVEAELDECTQSNVPNIARFNSFIKDKRANELTAFTKNNMSAADFQAMVGDRRALLAHDGDGFNSIMEVLGEIYYQIGSIHKKIEIQGTDNLTTDEMGEYKRLQDKRMLLIAALMPLDPIVGALLETADIEGTRYLDDLNYDSNARQILVRFMFALLNHKKNECQTLIGQLYPMRHELPSGEYEYYKALANYVSGDYEGTLYYIDKISKESGSYSNVLSLKLECCAVKGNIDTFRSIVVSDDAKYLTFEQVVYLNIVLHLNMPLEGVVEDEPAVLDEMLASGYAKLLCKDRNPYYVALLGRQIVDVILEGMEIIEDIISSSFVSGIIEVPNTTKQRLMQLKAAAGLTDWISTNIINFVDLDYVMDNNIEEVKTDAARVCIALLEQIPDKMYEDSIRELYCLLRLGQTDDFLLNISKNSEDLISLANNGMACADEILRLAYIKSMAVGNVDDKVKKYIEDQKNEDDKVTVKTKAIGAKIRTSLTVEGQKAFDAAETMFAQCPEEEIGRMDCGMICLGYSRIIELELTMRVVIPLIRSVGVGSIENLYNGYVNTLSGEAKKHYKNKWRVLNKIKAKIDDPTNDTLMLGELSYFFANLGSHYDENDSVAAVIRNHYGSVFNEYGREKLEEGFFEDITSEEQRNKYRNPPAHTKYLPYTVACEGRNATREALLQMSYMLKTPTQVV